VPPLRDAAGQVAARLAATGDDPYPSLRHGVAPHRPTVQRVSA
jgi:hypothetical protein